MGKSKTKKGKSKKGKSKAKKGNPEKPDKSGETSLRKGNPEKPDKSGETSVRKGPEKPEDDSGGGGKSEETILRKNRGKDDEVKSNRAVVESPKVEMGDEGESMNNANEEKSDKPGIDGKMGGDREVKKASFKNDKVKRKLEDTAVVMEKEVIASESVEVVEDTVVIMEKEASTSEIVEVELCPVCLEDVPEAEDERFTVDGCFHKVCVACMTQHLSYVLQQRKSLTCPMFGCKCELQTEDCNMIVGSDQMALMKQLKAEARIDVAHRVYCPNPRCSFLMSARELRVVDAALPGARQCLQCGSRFCINCKMEWHKKMTCSEFQKTKAYKRSDTAVFDAVARELGWKKCRKCHGTVEHAEGCKHMTCTFCKYEFCYSCGNEWIKRKPTCKCATKVDK